MPHGPGGLRGDAQLPGQLRRGEGLLGRGQKVDGEKPLLEAHPGLVEDGAGSGGNLIAAGGALVERPAFDGPGFRVRTARAAKTLRPPVIKEGFSAVVLRLEHFHELHQSLGTIHGRASCLGCLSDKQRLTTGPDGT